MPLLESEYTTRFPYTHAHFHTSFPTLFRPRQKADYERERFELSDRDFIDVDWHRKRPENPGRIALLLHGLEGSSRGKYIIGMANVLEQAGWNVAAFNMRGCSGEPNRLSSTYHSGKSEDLREVVSLLKTRFPESRFALIGFSLGGNVLLKYLGEEGTAAPVDAAVAFSVPCNLEVGAERLMAKENWLYEQRFVQSLKKKIARKRSLYPERCGSAELREIKNIIQFDEFFTAPLNGFKDATEYWQRSSCEPLLAGLAVPTLLVSALDDPLLCDSCYPVDSAKQNAFFHLELPKFGGHCGFTSLNGSPHYWSEVRTLRFLKETIV